MIDQAIRDIEELMAREELCQAWAVFASAWERYPAEHDTLWGYGYRIALLSDNRFIQGFFALNCKLMLKRFPGDASLLRQLATMYDAMEKPDDSLAIHRLLLRMRLPAEQRRDTEYSVATILLAKGRLREAKKILSSALRRIRHAGPMFAPYYGLMGGIEGKLGLWRAAMSWCDEAIRYDRSEPAWPRQCAIMLEGHSQHAKALRYWDMVLALPRDAVKGAVCDSGRDYWKQGEYMKTQKLAKEHRATCAAIAGPRS